MKQLAVVRERRWYQSRCNECDRDVGYFVPKFGQAQQFADAHNANVHAVAPATQGVDTKEEDAG